MANEPIPTTIPPELHRFFWDIDADKLNPGEHPLYVINRLLDKGDVQAVRWVRKSFPEEIIIETIRTRRDFSPKTISFWIQYYSIPREEVRWFQEPFRSLRKQLWPY